MSEIGLIADYLQIRQTQAINSLRKTIKQSENLSNSDSIVNILVNLETTFRKLAEDMMLLMPLENPNAWNSTFQQIIITINANINDEKILKDAVLANLKRSQNKPVQVSRKNDKIHNCLPASPGISKLHQTPKVGSYENWPIGNNGTKLGAPSTDFKNEQNKHVEKKPKKVTFSLFSQKSKSSSTFYVNLYE